MPAKTSGSRPQDIRRRNSFAVLNLLTDREDMTVAELAEAMELSRTAVQNILGELLEGGMVEPSSKRDSAVGKKSLSYAINPRYKYCICVHLSTNFVFAELFDFCLHRVNFHVSNPEPGRYEELIRRAAQSVRAVLDDSAIPPEELFGLVVSLSGMVDSTGSVLLEFTGSDIAPALGRNLHILEDLGRELGFTPPVMYMDNLCYFGAFSMLRNPQYRSCKSYLYVLGHDRGIGTAFISNRKLIKGANGLMGEIAHTTIDFRSRVRCRCGRLGCFEAMLYPEHITALVHEKLAAGAETIWNWGETVTLTDLARAAEAGDPFGRETTKQAATLFANLLRNAQIMYDPEAIIFHDSYSFASDCFHACIQEALAEVCGTAFPTPTLFFEKSDFTAGVRAGAALYCRDIYLQ